MPVRAIKNNQNGGMIHEAEKKNRKEIAELSAHAGDGTGAAAGDEYDGVCGFRGFLSGRLLEQQFRCLRNKDSRKSDNACK